MKKIGKDEYAAAFGFLSAHETDSLNMLGFLEYNETPDIWIGGNPVDCVVIRKKDTDMFFINAYSDESILSAAKEIFSLSEKVFFSGVRKEIADKLLALADKTDEDLLHDDCLLYLYPEKTIDVSDIPEKRPARRYLLRRNSGLFLHLPQSGQSRKNKKRNLFPTVCGNLYRRRNRLLVAYSRRRLYGRDVYETAVQTRKSRGKHFEIPYKSTARPRQNSFRSYRGYQYSEHKACRENRIEIRLSGRMVRSFL